MDDLPLDASSMKNDDGTPEVDTVHDLGDELQDTLQVKEEDSISSTDFPSDRDSSSSTEDDTISPPGEFDDISPNPNRCLNKCATFPFTVGGSTDEEEEKEEESNSLQRLFSLPTPRKLVSALKGSREKEGRAPQSKLSVSWAPDVYDPPPTSLSHHPKKKVQKEFKTSKKYGKGKQKAKGGGGGGGSGGPKDKKHYRKMGGKSDRCLDSCADTDRVMSSSKNGVVSSSKKKNSGYKKSAVEYFEDFDDDCYDSSESNCGGGGGFLGKASRANTLCIY